MDEKPAKQLHALSLLSSVSFLAPLLLFRMISKLAPPLPSFCHSECLLKQTHIALVTFSLPWQDTLPKQLKEGMKEDGRKEEGKKGFCGSQFEGIQPVTTQGTNGGGDLLVTLHP